MWWVTNGVGSRRARGEVLEDGIDVLDHVRVPGLQRQCLDPDDPHVDLDPLGIDAGGRDGPGLAGEAAGELERVRMADRVDRRVGAAALGQLLDGPSRITLGEVHRRRTQLARELEALRNRVDRDHVGRPLGDRRLDGAQADRPEPEHRRPQSRARPRTRRPRDSPCPSRRRRIARRRRTSPRAPCGG